MTFIPPVNVGDVINNDELCEIFKCSPQGGMRRSLKTNTLVLTTNTIESIYEDRWEGDILHYTGMGQTGDQQLDFQQNKTLAHSNDNSVKVHLFEVLEPQKYTYQGQVKLVAKPYQETQPDTTGKDRLVWIFPLQVIGQGSSAGKVAQVNLDTAYKRKERIAKKLSDQELQNRANHSHNKPGKRSSVVTQYQRSPWVSEFAKRRANGVCELCNMPAPFPDAAGNTYLETHHIQWLAKGGDDSIQNTVALCPNCHKKMHVVDDGKDRKKLEQVATLGKLG